MNEAAGTSVHCNPVHRWPEFVTRGMSALLMALGLMVIVGWHAHWPALIQLHASFAPMQYNTALDFLCAGAALLAINLKRRRLALPLAGFVTLLGLLTLGQYAFARSFGIDQLLFHPYIFTQSPFPGRMSIVSALAFSLSGLALIFTAAFHPGKWRPLLISLLNSIVLALGSMAMLGYITGLTGANGWGELTQMALLTATGFMAFSLGLFASLWQEEFATTNRSPRWLPVATGLTALSATLILGHALGVRERTDMERTLQANAAIVKNEIVARLDSRIRSLGRMAGRWEFSGRPEREVWEADATAYFQEPGYQGIVWVDPELRVRWAVPLARNSEMLGKDLAMEERRRLALESARDQNRATFTRPVQLFQGGGVGTLLSVPIYRQGRFEGFIVGVIRFQELLDATLRKDLAAGYAIEIAERGHSIYERPDGPKPLRKGWVAELPIEILGTDWAVQVWPGVELLAAERSDYTQAVLILGGLASILLGLSVYLAQGAHTRSQLLVATNQELQREIAERHRAEREVQKLGELQRAIVSHAAYSVISTTPEGVITSFNPAAERMLGYNSGEMVGKLAAIRIHEPGEIAERAKIFSVELGEKVEPGFEVFVIKARRNLPNHYEWTYVRKDGSRFPVMLEVTVLRDKVGYITGFLGIAEDISELKRAEAELKKSHQDLLEISRQAGMAEVATSVLHNVGNVLNSVNVSVTVVASAIRKSKVDRLPKVAALLRDHEADLAAFLSGDPRGRQLPGYIAQLAELLTGEQTATLHELAGLQKNIEHINDIVARQQSYARVSGVTETLRISDVVEDALRMSDATLASRPLELVREYAEVSPVNIEKHKVLQVLVNLIRNAQQACDQSGRADQRLTVCVADGEGRIKISVKDNGVGIPSENLTRIFSHGFTTRKGGHGFGLHSGALAAMEMGGSLTVHSEGLGQGATFTLELPCSTNGKRHE